MKEGECGRELVLVITIHLEKEKLKLIIVSLSPVADLLYSKVTSELRNTGASVRPGFVDINDNSNFSGTHTVTLQLSNIPSARYGYKLRCRVNAAYSELFGIKFANSWTSAVSSAWENGANWSRGFVAYANTDVLINSGMVVINSNVTIHSINMNSEVNLKVASGFVLTVLH